MRVERALLGSPKTLIRRQGMKARTPRGELDGWLLFVSIALIAFGVVMVYSASAVWADRYFHDGQHFLLRQSCYALVGVAVMVVLSRVPFSLYQRATYPVLGLSLLLLVVVAIGFGHRAGGASRWISVGPVHIQPAELSKFALILWLAYSLSRKGEQIRSFSVGFLPHILVSALLMLLCLGQPDFGSAVMIGLLTVLMLFTAGAKLGYILTIVVAATPLAWALVATSEYRLRRLRSFLEPFKHRYGAGYQVAESLISFGSGGVWGNGLGDSKQKLFFLPEAHTDFISAIVGEELGFVGVGMLVLAYGLLIWRGLRAAWRAKDEYATYLAVGITAFLGVQSMTNLAVAMGMLPTKGLVLPFVSYGGSSLLVNCASVGILLNASRTSVEDEVFRQRVPQGFESARGVMHA